MEILTLEEKEEGDAMAVPGLVDMGVEGEGRGSVVGGDGGGGGEVATRERTARQPRLDLEKERVGG